MVVGPMIRNNICMNAHPVGCERYVRQQIEYVQAQSQIDGPESVLVIGASGGYGLASRIVSAFGCNAATVGVSYETPAKGRRTATAGWYNDLAFKKAADQAGLLNQSLIADAFSHETKAAAIDAIKELSGTVDLVVYSLASGVRTDPDTGEQFFSALKPIGRDYSGPSLNSTKGELEQKTLPPASQEEIDATVKVMGGEDWSLWIKALKKAKVLSKNARTVAYSYIGPSVTYPLYRDGTIGRAKEHLEATAFSLTKELSSLDGAAYVSINKALVTRASSVIPSVPLYLAILYRVMKDKGLHEGTIEQMYRMFSERLYRSDGEVPVDSEGRIRLDDWEMREDVQSQVTAIWNRVSQDNLDTVADLEGFNRDFLEMHGFGFPDVDYNEDVGI